MSIFGGKKAASIQPDFSGLALQTSSSAMPIPIVYGVTRVAPNVIWYAGVYARPEKSGGGLFGHVRHGHPINAWMGSRRIRFR